MQHLKIGITSVTLIHSRIGLEEKVPREERKEIRPTTA
jgi:hypothetical protein